MNSHGKYPFSVSQREIDAFEASNPSVGQFLGKYSKGGGTYSQRARYLCMFFKWLRTEKKLELSAGEFLNLLALKRASLDPADRLWGRDLALGFSRDNPAFRGRGVAFRYGALFQAVKLFCDSREVPLTSAKGIFGERFRNKYDEPAFTVEKAKQVLGLQSQRDRAICLCMLQSGQSTKQILVDANAQFLYIRGEIEAGRERIRLDFRERKGNGFKYFSYISVDAIQELRKWLKIRESWLAKAGLESNSLFLTKDCTPLRPHQLTFEFRQRMMRKKMWTGPYSVRLHMFRKIFEQEADPPDRGISQKYVKFFLGHAGGADNGTIDKLDCVGGVYNKRPFFDSSTAEKEYAKLEPYLNIYSSSRAGSSDGFRVNDEDMATLKMLLDKFKEGKVKISL